MAEIGPTVDAGTKMKTEIKCVVVGDAAVGKTCMLISYTTNKFPGEYQPTVFDNYTTKIKVNGEVVVVHLWDTAGSEHFDVLRPLSYSGTDVFLVCYAIGDRNSFDNVKDKWVKDLKDKVPSIPFMVVGTKADLRAMSSSEAGSLIPLKEGEDLAKSLGAKEYVECSSLTQEGLKEAFNRAITIALSTDGSEAPPKPSGCKCVLQ